jgi:hypothetical protein
LCGGITELNYSLEISTIRYRRGLVNVSACALNFLRFLDSVQRQLAKSSQITWFTKYCASCPPVSENGAP